MTDQRQYRLAYQEIDVAFLEPTARMRAVLRSTLHAVGFRRLLDCHSVDEVVQRLSDDGIDLLIIDVDSNTDVVCNVVRQVREGRIGYDPFVAIMALTSNAVPAVINRILDVGCDDLIARPISPKVIAGRVANLVHNRKPFVVKADYVGPDRGGRQRDDHELPKLDVPNALRRKGLENAGSPVSVASLRQARETMSKHRIARIATRIGAEALRLKSRAASDERVKSDPDERKHLAELLAMIDSVSELVAEQSLDELEPLNQSMSRLAGSMAAQGVPNDRQLALLHLHGEAIAATVSNREEVADLADTVLNHPMSRAAE